MSSAAQEFESLVPISGSRSQGHPGQTQRLKIAARLDPAQVSNIPSGGFQQVADRRLSGLSGPGDEHGWRTPGQLRINHQRVPHGVVSLHNTRRRQRPLHTFAQGIGVADEQCRRSGGEIQGIRGIDYYLGLDLGSESARDLNGCAAENREENHVGLCRHLRRCPNWKALNLLPPSAYPDLVPMSLQPLCERSPHNAATNDADPHRARLDLSALPRPYSLPQNVVTRQRSIAMCPCRAAVPKTPSEWNPALLRTRWKPG